MVRGHSLALEGVGDAIPQIAAAAALIAAGLQKGAVIHYAAAGSSGLMALADACELPGTFGLPQSQIRISMAGGVPTDGHMPGDTEDNCKDAEHDSSTLRAGDIAIVLSASGTTPYALAFASTAKGQGARVIGIANGSNPPLLQMADVAIALKTGPEVVEGSTRLSAGTAQKVALNMISTQVGILLGHVHNGLMVNLNPDNIKLRHRAAAIVSRIAAVNTADAERALAATDYDTKRAVLVVRGLHSDAAAELLDRHKGHLGPCLRELPQVIDQKK